MPDYTQYEAITVAGTAVGLTAATITGLNKGLITCESAQIRFTVDGTTATATVGHILNDGDVLKLENMSELNKFSAIRTGGVSATLRCSYGN